MPGLRKLGGPSLAALREFNHGHIKARELRSALTPEVFDPLFKFAFVRNPWDWQVSIYHYVRQLAEHPEHELYMTMETFDDYLDYRINQQGPELQSEFVLGDSGESLADFVGRYEVLAEHFATVCERIGIGCELPHRNASRHRDFREYYTPRTRALVAEAYDEDIRRFGYSFDRPPSREPVWRY